MDEESRMQPCPGAQPEARTNPETVAEPEAGANPEGSHNRQKADTKDSRKNSLTEGTIWKKLLFFALPIFLGQVFQQLYNTFDSLIVGKFLGDQALAAVSSSGSLIFMLVGYFKGVAIMSLIHN